MPDETTTLEERIAMGEDSMLELKPIAFSGGRVVSPDMKDIADEFAAAANASGATFVIGGNCKTFPWVQFRELHKNERPPNRLISRISRKCAHSSDGFAIASLLREHALIVPVLGEGKGKYRFNGCKSGGEVNLVKYQR